MNINLGMNSDGPIGKGIFVDHTSIIDVVADTKEKLKKELKTTGIIEQHFLRPKAVMFAHQPEIKPKVIAVACGFDHIAVIAMDPCSSRGNLFTSGLNGAGQLGHGDTVDRHVLTLVCSQL